MTGFSLRVDDETELVLREQWTVQPLHDLIVANLDRLRPWEPWASGEQLMSTAVEFTRAGLQEFVAGANVPTAIRFRGELVGVVSARINGYFGVAELGYWIGRAHEGTGVMTRSVLTLLDYLIGTRGIARVEIRTAAANHRSCALAERLGFDYEGTLRSALPIGDQRLDLAVYGLLAPRSQTGPLPSG